RTIQIVFLAAFGCTQIQQKKLRAWILFLTALHDFGKFDLRFQLKGPNALTAAWRSLGKENHGVSQSDITIFDHGWAGIAWANQEYRHWVGNNDADRQIWEIWRPWLAAVTGHHGVFFEPTKIYASEADIEIVMHDRDARQGYIFALSDIFLTPEGLDFQNSLPFTSPGAQCLLAGFCAVCDWIGSNTEVFIYQNPDFALADYFAASVKKVLAETVLYRFGLLSQVIEYKGVSALLKIEESPRGVQFCVDSLPAAPGLALIEAPTGSGKTEAALAYAWRLLDYGVADSIVFALPTQATANVMLIRVEEFAVKVFGNANVVLAHGKRDFNKAFQRLADGGRQKTAQGAEEASIQCTAWLASSRKRFFLGQIGVCTVDQVLLSVLPVRHKFVRSFGLNKSVLIVDEVHAYDAYMHGLLGEVLRRQKTTGGSTILLSATLPAGVRGKLLKAWESSEGVEDAPYPALWHITQGMATCTTVPDDQLPARREVTIEYFKLPGAFPNDALIDRIIAAAESGARVAVVINLVDDAQRLAKLLRNKTTIAVNVFHSRYRFTDRQEKEKDVLENYGREAVREKGSILVATQVVEQNLDLDFDWMLTQICPVDLLFQRLGPLHRHRRGRPIAFEMPKYIVLSVEGEDYGLHKLIYGNTRVLWRTEQLLVSTSKITFPEAYRNWIEQVYQRDDWIDEPKSIALGYDEFSVMQRTREADALQLTTMTVKTFRDKEAQVTELTRDGEMSLTVLPVLSDGYLLDGKILGVLYEYELAETLNLQAIPVPASWEKRLKDCRLENQGNLAGYRQLEMCADDHGGWLAINGKFRYSEDFGLEQIYDEST
ncbi:MAG: CRISPR-associated helicase/endonuclease Cas3, partial [Nitrosomonadaceae bacterium]|nr:CRISPR-associated helicase/endonuclease Cas3 [Nitrosomonadaceae bacterium]